MEENQVIFARGTPGKYINDVFRLPGSTAVFALLLRGPSSFRGLQDLCQMQCSMDVYCTQIQLKQLRNGFQKYECKVYCSSFDFIPQSDWLSFLMSLQNIAKNRAQFLSLATLCSCRTNILDSEINHGKPSVHIRNGHIRVKADPKRQRNNKSTFYKRIRTAKYHTYELDFIPRIDKGFPNVYMSHLPYSAPTQN